MRLSHPTPPADLSKGEEAFDDFHKCRIATVIPCYRVEREIQSALRNIPSFVKHIIVVDDGSPDATADLVTALANEDERILLIRHPSNQGVNGHWLSQGTQAQGSDHR